MSSIVETFRARAEAKLDELRSELASRKASLADARKREASASDMMLRAPGPVSEASYLRAQAYRSALERKIYDLEQTLRHCEQLGADGESRAELKTELDRRVAKFHKMIAANDETAAKIARDFVEQLLAVDQALTQMAKQENEAVRELKAIAEAWKPSVESRELANLGITHRCKGVSGRRAACSRIMQDATREDLSRYRALRDFLRAAEF